MSFLANKTAFLCVFSLMISFSAHAYTIEEVAEQIGVSPDQEVTLATLEPEIQGDDTLAPDLEKVSSDTLRLFGGGFVNQHSGFNGNQKEGIVAACLNENCDQFRFVYFPGNGEAYYFGYQYSVSESAGKKGLNKAPEEQRKVALKNILKEYKNWVKENRKRNPELVAVVLVGSALGTMKLCSMFIVGAAGMGVAFAVIMVVPTVLVMFASSGLPMNVDGKIAESVTNQHGWSWAGNAKEIKEKDFNLFLRHFNPSQSLEPIRHPKSNADTPTPVIQQN